MRSLLTSLIVVALCAGLLEVLPASASLTSASARAAGAHRRSWKMSLAPAVDDIALAQVGFPHARGARLRRGSLSVGAGAPFADDYLTAGAVLVRGSRVKRALVLLANRATDLADPVRVSLRASAVRALGAPKILQASDPFTRASVKPPALCDLPLHGTALAPAQLLVLGSRGTPLKGFGAAAALAEAYDAVCHLPYSSAFKTALASASTVPSPPTGNPPAPAPSPIEPLPSPPGCQPCVPSSKLFACPLAQPSVCVFSPRTRAGAAGAH
jgi:hypothetical protein